MDDDFRPDRETVKEWEACLGRLFDAIPKGKRGILFTDMSFLETTGKRALWATIRAQEKETAAQQS